MLKIILKYSNKVKTIMICINSYINGLIFLNYLFCYKKQNYFSALAMKMLPFELLRTVSGLQPSTPNPLTKTDELTTTNEKKTRFNNTLSQLLCNPIVSLRLTPRVLTQLAKCVHESLKMSY